MVDNLRILNSIDSQLGIFQLFLPNFSTYFIRNCVFLYKGSKFYTAFKT